MLDKGGRVIFSENMWDGYQLSQMMSGGNMIGELWTPNKTALGLWGKAKDSKDHFKYCKNLKQIKVSLLVIGKD